MTSPSHCERPVRSGSSEMPVHPAADSVCLELDSPVAAVPVSLQIREKENIHTASAEVLATTRRALIRLLSEDQKIIHAVGFHEILRVTQFVSGLGGFANDDVFTHAMIFSVAIAINNADLGSWLKR